MTTPDFRALCAELLAGVDEYVGMNPYMRLDNAMKAARAALAAEPEPPDAGEAPQPVPKCLGDGPAVPEGREPAAVVEEPSDEEIASWAAASSVPGEFLYPDSGRWERCLSSEEFCATVRAALAFWSQP